MLEKLVQAVSVKSLYTVSVRTMFVYIILVQAVSVQSLYKNVYDT